MEQEEDNVERDNEPELTEEDLRSDRWLAEHWDELFPDDVLDNY